MLMLRRICKQAARTPVALFLTCPTRSFVSHGRGQLHLAGLVQECDVARTMKEPIWQHWAPLWSKLNCMPTGRMCFQVMAYTNDVKHQLRSMGESTSSKCGKTSQDETTADCDASKVGRDYKMSLEDFQHEEIVGPTVERDMSAVATELREAQVELTSSMQKLMKVLIAVGSAHLLWGAMMFKAMESPHSHVIFVQTFLVSMILFGLAYHLKQALKPIAFFTKLEERSRLRVITLSLQITKTFSSFCQRGHGIAFLHLCVLVVHLLACLKVYFLYSGKAAT